VYVFGELMEMPSVKELEKSENSGFWNLLNIFALGTFAEYKGGSTYRIIISNVVVIAKVL